jgi:hypothetical protein
MFGVTQFRREEVVALGIEKATNALRVEKRRNSIKKSRQGSLFFPGNSSIDGYVVGIEIRDHRGDSSNGKWCLRRDFSLGRKQLRVHFKADPRFGMHVCRLNLLGRQSRLTYS